MSFELVLTEEDSPADRDAIKRTLRAYNLSQGHQPRERQLGLLLRDPKTGETVGGLWGRTAYDWLVIEFFVIPESLRGQNLGTKLIRQAEEIAIARGCIGAWLTTLAFQARPFYEKLGYTCVGQIDDNPPGAKRFFMQKRFGDTKPAYSGT